VKYHAEFASLYYRREQAHWGYKYLQGLMAPIEEKTIQPMAMALKGGNIQAMQQFIGQGRWQDEKLLRRHRELVDETLGEEQGVYIVDDSGFPKKGQHSVGVARQWCGVLGKVENCQVGVFGAYASRAGYTLVDHRLYLPPEWFDEAHRERWRKCGIPREMPFQSKPALALEMLQTGNCSDLGGGEELRAGDEGVEPLQAPGSEETGQDTLGLAAQGGSGSSAYLAAHRQGPNGPLSRIVVRRDPEIDHEVEKLIQETLAALAQDPLRHLLLQEGLTQSHQLALEAMRCLDSRQPVPIAQSLA
jgi:hypothetical protein